MITERQQQLARSIANAGIWKYTKTVELMEKQSPVVEYLKRALNPPVNVSYGSFSAEEQAYLNARLAEELGAATFGQAYVWYVDRDPKSSFAFVPKKIDAARKEKDISVEWINEQQPRWFAEKDAYMRQRIATCIEGIEA